ncbi:type II secretion system protein [uncultured Fibrobacter sp.]|uniref:type II secretion system protein n=1 Tax=uncultured Fibrobacter sp. TaxID=261512 RepID=UPI0025E371D8|nr:type II secretion system protein [uncultured Fibrobacter sp.]
MKRGFTLMELMVYMAILGIIVLIAGEAFSNSTKFRIRTQNMLKASQEAENVGMLFKEDVAQMGAKATLSASTYGFYPRVYMDPTNADNDNIDSSSFSITATDLAHDKIAFKRVRYNNGAYEAIDSVVWETIDKKLYRSCKTVFGTATEDCPDDEPLSVEMATGVDTFKVTPATPGATEATSIIFPVQPTPPAPANKEFRLIPRVGEDNFFFVTVSPSDGGTTVSLTGLATNYDFENEAPLLDHKNGNQVFIGEKNSTSGKWNVLCYEFSLEPNIEYEIAFSMPYSNDAARMFVPGRDHLSIGFRKMDDGRRPSQLEDFLFFPSVSNVASIKRSMRFTVKEAIEDVCMAITFATYSPVAASGTIRFSDFLFKKVESANYNFDGATIATTEKKNVKAMRLRLSVSRGAHGDGRGETGDITLVVPTPSNGPRD